MVRVMEEIVVSRPQQAVLMAMAEHANDDGSRCFPSVDLIAWKAGYKPRNVADIIRELRKAGVIEEVAPATGTRPTEYALHLDRAPKKLTFEEWQKLNGRHRERYVGVQNDESRGAISRESGVQSHEEGCILTGLGVQNDEIGVQSHEKTTRENAPRTVSRTVIEPSRTGVSSSAIAREGHDPVRLGQPPPTNFLPHPIFDEWVPDEKLREELAAAGFSDAEIDREVPGFRDYYLGKGTTQIDWRPVFRRWMRRSREFAHTRASINSPPNLHVQPSETFDFWGSEQARAEYEGIETAQRSRNQEVSQ